MESAVIFSEQAISGGEIVETITLADFLYKFFTKFTSSDKILFRGLFYEDLLFAMRLLSEKYPVEQLDFDDYHQS